LAVLKFKSGPAVVIELGFITNDNDRNFLIDGANRESICNAIAGVLK
jgi:N-acetylmuramoyl-L-alanine amidase